MCVIHTSYKAELDTDPRTESPAEMGPRPCGVGVGQGDAGENSTSSHLWGIWGSPDGLSSVPVPRQVDPFTEIRQMLP